MRSYVVIALGTSSFTWFLHNFIFIFNSPVFPGYLICGMFLNENHELIMLLVNTIQKVRLFCNSLCVF